MELMLDLETLSNGGKSPIISIGAVFFDIGRGILGPEFYAVLDVDAQIKKGLLPNMDTIKWWMRQSKEAKSLFKTKGADPKTALLAFTDFFKQHTSVSVWGNGSSFDVSILENLYDTFDQKQPWTYSKIMDLRTFKRFVAKGAKVEIEGVAHNALDDARSQAKYVLKYSDNTKS